MRKSIDFSKGVRGKHAGMKLNVMGAIATVWAVCVTKQEKNLIPFKLYSIETFSESDEVRLKNESGEIKFYPKEWFAPLEVSEKTLGLLEKAA